MCVSMLPTSFLETLCQSVPKVHRKGSSKIWGHRAISDFRYTLLEGRLSLQGPAANNPLWPMTSGYMSSLRDVAEKFPREVPTVYRPRLLIMLRAENSTSNTYQKREKLRRSRAPWPNKRKAPNRARTIVFQACAFLAHQTLQSPT